jgi:hypothetical protein
MLRFHTGANVMADLTNEVLAHLDDAHIRAIAAQLGVDPAQAEGAIQQAMPLLIRPHRASAKPAASVRPMRAS